MPDFQETIAAIGTPAGTAALAILRVSGPDTRRIITELAGVPPVPRRARHGDYRAVTGEVIDDVIFLFFQGPASYSGEDLLEISCHGNPFIAQKILEDLLARGCRIAEPGEFTQRAFLNGRIDLTQAEGVMDVIAARSDRALAAANQQLRGALGRRINALIESLLQTLARVEAYIDFPDEDLPDEDRVRVAAEIGSLRTETERLLATSRYGELLRDGVKTVIIGPPNVGKSSLLNRLVGKERALVSAEPGTTRDFIEERIVVGPHCLRLIDTAGLNPSPAPLEQLGMAKTLERAAEADLFLVVVAPGNEALSCPADLTALMTPQNTLLILNKIDLGIPLISNHLRSFPAVSVSALTGQGIEDLTGRLSSMIDALGEHLSGEMVAINARHSHALASSRMALESAARALEAQGPVELLASDLRGALASFGEIAGRVDNERMLDALFATFCIGK